MNVNDLGKQQSLDGEWQFQLGADAPWGVISVPGCWEAQGYSKALDGPACYRREALIPADWAGERIFIEFGAVSYACDVRVNGQTVGAHLGLWTPFRLEISAAARPGEINRFEVEVYKPGETADPRYPMRACLAGFLPDVASSFGGLWQPVRLRTLRAELEPPRVDVDPFRGEVKITSRAVDPDGAPLTGAWQAVVRWAGQPQAEISGELGADGSLAAALSVAQPELWSPEHPALYELELRVGSAIHPLIAYRQRFGFRRLETRADRLLFNGQEVLLRGVLSWGWKPERVAPLLTEAEARAEIRRVKAQGFNLIKLCLFVPDPIYFAAADEEGVFLWEELPLWLPQVTPELRARAPGEYAEITRLVRGHPSVVLYTLGCEMNADVDGELLAQLNAAVRGLVSGAAFCDNSGSGESYGGLDFDFADFTDYHPYYDLHYFEPLLDNWRRDWITARPWIFGEFNDADGYRSQAELRAAHGGQKPWWLTAEMPTTTWRPEAAALIDVDERLARANPGLPEERLVQIAAEQACMVRKYTIETLRRRRAMGGYVVTGLRDTPIATSGVFDDFDRPKWPAETALAFNSDSILCLDGVRRRRWRFGGDRPERVDLHNHWSGESADWRVILSAYTGLAGQTGPRELLLDWSLTGADGETIAAGQARAVKDFRASEPLEVAALRCSLPEVSTARRLTLRAALRGAGLDLTNTWPVWVYPRVRLPAGLGVYDPASALEDLADWLGGARRLNNAPQPEDIPVLAAAAWADWMPAYLQLGGSIVLLQQGDAPLPARRGPFWRENLRLISDHPLWAGFAHEGWAGLQFFGLAGDVMFETGRLGEVLSADWVRPVLRRLDAREFYMTDYLFEAGIGRGRLLACALRVQGGRGAQPGGARNPAGAFLLGQMTAYLADPRGFAAQGGAG
jgi:hypothetical protein